MFIDNISSTGRQKEWETVFNYSLLFVKIGWHNNILEPLYTYGRGRCEVKVTVECDTCFYVTRILNNKDFKVSTRV